MRYIIHETVREYVTRSYAVDAPDKEAAIARVESDLSLTPFDITHESDGDATPEYEVEEDK